MPLRAFNVVGIERVRAFLSDPVAPPLAQPVPPLPALEVRVGISSLWRREIALSRVVIEDAVLDYTEAADTGPVRLPDRFSDRVETGPVTVAIGPVALVRVRLLYRAPASGLALR